MKKSGIVFALGLALLFLVTACATAPKTDNGETESVKVTDATDASASGRSIIEERARGNPSAQCVTLCEKAIQERMDLARGPCLSDDEPFPEDWACDVAHRPRWPLDNDPKNQCEEYRDGKVSHFVEVDENCNFIRRG